MHCRADGAIALIARRISSFRFLICGLFVCIIPWMRFLATDFQEFISLPRPISRNHCGSSSRHESEDLLLQQADIANRLTASPRVGDVQLSWQTFEDRRVRKLTI